MNWGLKITFALVGFIGFILYMVIHLSLTHVDLETTDYYQRELDFEQQIKAERNAVAAEKDIAITTRKEGVLVDFSAIENFDKAKGQILFFRPNSADKDIYFSLKGDKEYYFPADQFATGKYHVKVEYKIAGEPFYHSQTIFLP